MSKWFPDTSSQEGTLEALKAGKYGAIAYSLTVVLALIFVAASGHLPGEAGNSSQVSEFIGDIVELAVIAFAAWRFHIGKGLIWGSLITLMFVADIGLKVANGTASPGWVVFYLAIFIALVNGVRGAWAARRHGAETDIAEVFE